MSEEKITNANEDGINEVATESDDDGLDGNHQAYKNEDVDEKELSSFVQGTAESLLSKLEETVAATTISNRGLPFGKPRNARKKGTRNVDNAKEAKEEDDDMEDDEEEEEEEFLQDTNPGPLGLDGKDVEDVLSIISQSIYREGEGKQN